VEESTFKELMESKHHSPEITDVIYDFNQLEELTLDSVNVVEKGFDTVWTKPCLIIILNICKMDSNCLKR
jgi:hypothetical protein